MASQANDSFVQQFLDFVAGRAPGNQRTAQEVAQLLRGQPPAALDASVRNALPGSRNRVSLQPLRPLLPPVAEPTVSPEPELEPEPAPELPPSAISMEYLPRTIIRKRKAD